MQHDATLIDAARQSLAGDFDYVESLGRIRELIQKNDQWRNLCINMVAAESLLSPNAQAALASGLSMRTAGGYIGKQNRFFVGSENIDTLESLLFAILARIFQCGQAEWRLLGGTQACQAVYAALCKPGDTVITVPEHMGGDSGNTALSMPGYLGLKVIPMPFKPDGLTIDIDTLDSLIQKEKPALISLGFSVSLFYPPIREIKTLCTRTGTLVYYDAAHELGLIAGKQLPCPFTEGADVVTGSTGKSFSGPQGGLLLWNDTDATGPLKHHVFPGFVGSYQLNRVAALCLTAFELHEHGERFMAAVVNNARYLAEALTDNMLTVHGHANGYTETNQVLLTLSEKSNGRDVAEKLAAVNIIGNPVQVPGKRQPAIRLSTTEVTRLGMGKKEMETIAEIISRTLYDKDSPSVLLERTLSLSKKFQTVHYC